MSLIGMLRDAKHRRVVRFRRRAGRASRASCMNLISHRRIA